MDGNGRWAKNQGWRRVRGHEEGAESVRAVVTACRKFGLEALTLYAFSDENWARPKTEVKALMGAPGALFEERAGSFDRKGYPAQHHRRYFPSAPILAKNIERGEKGPAPIAWAMVLTVALSYGSRQEILRAVRALAEEVAAGRLSPSQVDEAALESPPGHGGAAGPGFSDPYLRRAAS